MREEIEKAIVELSYYLNNDIKDENTYQKWFETHPIVFQSLGYKDFIPHPVLNLGNDEKYIPDFLVQRIDGIWEIFELKTPNVKILKDKERRIDFYSNINEYHAQCVEYCDFFLEKCNRERFKSDYKIEIQNRLNGILVVGLDNGIDKFKIHELTYKRGQVKILTYSDILNFLEFERVENHSIHENLNGFSFHMVMKLLKIPEKNYLLDVGSIERNRISLFIDETDSLKLRIIDKYGEINTIRLQKGVHFEYDEKIYLNFEIGFYPQFTAIVFEINGKIAKDLRYDSIEIEVAESPNGEKDINMSIGADLNESNYGAFQMARHIVYNRTLSFHEKIQIKSVIFHDFFFSNEPQNCMNIRKPFYLKIGKE